jgi:Cdc6-like AAA superfamily ATPase
MTSGAGKTAAVQWVLRKHFPNASVYVNCWRKRTAHKVMDEVLSQMGLFSHGTAPTSELVKRLENSGRKPVICLDEADQLREIDILYDLARNSNGIILVSDQPSIVAEMDDRLRSSLFLSQVELCTYSIQDSSDILRQRVDSGFRPGTVDETLLSLTARMSSGNMRMVLHALKFAAKEAESKNLPAVTADGPRAAMSSVRRFSVSYLLSKLNEHQRAIYGILKKVREADSKKLFGEYRAAVKAPVVARAYRNYMKRMEEAGLVRSEGVGRWKRYRIVLE